VKALGVGAGARIITAPRPILAETNLTGRTLKQYQLVGKLGAGGMGDVYRARDTVLGRDAAVKVLHADRLPDGEARQRFLREARAASALNHPNVVTVYEIGSDDGVDFIAMEFVGGETLQSLMRQRRLRIAEAASYAAQAADALGKAHAAGVVHRDIKPSNLAITADGLVKVLDFGLARLNEAAIPDGDDSTRHVKFATRAGMIIGTIAYMSPEQARGDEAGPASDVFSLGIVLFEMLSGQRPFEGSSEMARLHNLHFTPPKDLRQLAPDVPEGLACIVARMLEKEPTARYSLMADVRQELRQFAAAEGLGAPLRAAEERQTTRPPALTIAIAGAVLAAIVVAGGVALWMLPARSPATRGRPPATTAGAAIDPDATPRDLYVKARGLLDRFDREANPGLAITLLERAIEKDANFAPAYAALTEAYHFRHQVSPDQQWVNLMQQNAQRAIQLNPDLAAAHVAMAIALSDQKKGPEADAAFRRAIDLDPRSAQAYRWMSVAPYRTKAQVTDSFQRALALDPNNWVVLMELGLQHYRESEYAKALSFWEKARDASPDNVRVLANLSAAYHMLDRDDEAASTLQRAIEVEPAARLFTNLGTLRFFQGRYADAVPPLERAVELSPNRYLYWANLADAYRWAPGAKAKAANAYARAIEIIRAEIAKKPDDVDLQSRLALFLAKSDDKDAALGALRSLDQKASLQGVMLFRIGVAYEVCGARDKALAAIEKALKAGYAAKEIRGEPELLNLRSDIRFHKMIAALPAAGSPAQK